MPPRLVLNEFDLDFPATGLLILRPTLFVVVVVATAVDGIVVLDEGVVADGREAVVPGVGTRTLILSRRGCDGIRHVAMEDEKGKSTKVSKERRRRSVSEKRGEIADDLVLSAMTRASGAEDGGTGEAEGRGTSRDERTMGWRGRAFWNGKLFLVGRRRPSWAKKEQAIYISKQPSLESHPLIPFYGNFHHFSFSASIQSCANCFIDCSDYRSPNSTVSSSSLASPLCPTTPTFAIDTIAIKHAVREAANGCERKGKGSISHLPNLE